MLIRYRVIVFLVGLVVFYPGCASVNEQKSGDTMTRSVDAVEDKKEKDTTRPGPGDTESVKPETTTADIDAGTKRLQKSGLQAGFVDDNKQFNRFTNSFLVEYGESVTHYPLPVKERIILRVRDVNGRSLANAGVKVFSAGSLLASGLTSADGTFLFFPSEYGASLTRFDTEISYAGKKKTVVLSRDGEREKEVIWDGPRKEIRNVPLDLLFVLDTTSSMGEEIERLKTTIEIIYSNLVYFSSKPSVRFGMVLFRDQGDEYVTKLIPLTADIASFQASLDKVSPDGGGDWDEDLQAALFDAMTKVSWNRDGIRLAFIITDAPPHLDYGQQYTYVSACHEAREKGIKLMSIGTGELPLAGEYILRQISQYTYAKYIFLTYGERSDSEGGKAGSVSHHVGTNYRTDKLESIIMQIAREELSFLTEQPLKEDEEFFQAVKIEEESTAETLTMLFNQAFTQLVDYSSLRLPPGTPASILPYAPGAKTIAKQCEYFTEQSLFSIGAQKFFKLVERENLQAVLKEMELQLSDLADETTAARVGKLLGAEVLVTGKVYLVKDNYEIFLKLIRVETSEILSVIKVKIDKKLGL